MAVAKWMHRRQWAFLALVGLALILIAVPSLSDQRADSVRAVIEKWIPQQVPPPVGSAAQPLPTVRFEGSGMSPEQQAEFVERLSSGAGLAADASKSPPPVTGTAAPSGTLNIRPELMPGLLSAKRPDNFDEIQKAFGLPSGSTEKRPTAAQPSVFGTQIRLDNSTPLTEAERARFLPQSDKKPLPTQVAPTQKSIPQEFNGQGTLRSMTRPDLSSPGTPKSSTTFDGKRPGALRPESTDNLPSWSESALPRVVLDPSKNGPASSANTGPTAARRPDDWVGNREEGIAGGCLWPGCRPWSVPEGESCTDGGIDDYNGGCNSASPAFSGIIDNARVCGTASFDGSTRDTDWYVKTLNDGDTVTFCVTAEFPVQINILDIRSGCPGLINMVFTFAGPCDTAYLGYRVPPGGGGDYVFFVAPDFVAPLPCAEGPWEYQAWLSCWKGCDPTAIPEGEACIENGFVDGINQGCNAGPNFSVISNNVTVCGTIASDPSGYPYDVDWYLQTLAEGDTITWCLTGEAAIGAGLYDLTSGCYGNWLGDSWVDACETLYVGYRVPPGGGGAYSFAIFHPIFYGSYPPIPCADGPWEYELRVFGGSSGENCNEPIVIPALPYTTLGNTAGHRDDYDELCPFNAPGSPDLVYNYRPRDDEMIEVLLCNSSYDTKVIVYEDECRPGAAYQCNDDACGDIRGAAFASRLPCFKVYAGHRYFIVVDGYGGDAGPYELEVRNCTPCEFRCDPAARSEGETCDENLPDTYNSGCYSEPPSFSVLTDGKVCGTTWNVAALGGDQDWWTTAFHAGDTATWCVTAEFPFTAVLWSLVDGCVSAFPLDHRRGWSCDTVYFGLRVPPGGDGIYALQIIPTINIVDLYCADGPWEYEITLTTDRCIEQCPPWGIAEGEPCGNDPDNFNGGCNSSPEAYSPIEFDQPVCGTAWADGGTRDTDWYLKSLAEGDSVTWCMTADFPFHMLILDHRDGCPIVEPGELIANQFGDPCETLYAGFRVPPGGGGDYVFFASVYDFNGFPCANGPWHYQAVLNLHCWPGCDADAIPEGEACDENTPDHYNGGCLANTPSFSFLYNGAKVCGNVWFRNPPFGLDYDWYLTPLQDGDSATWCLSADFDFGRALLQVYDDCTYGVITQVFERRCGRQYVGYRVPPGGAGYYSFVVFPLNGPLYCAQGPWEYQLSLNVEPIEDCFESSAFMTASFDPGDPLCERSRPLYLRGKTLVRRMAPPYRPGNPSDNIPIEIVKLDLVSGDGTVQVFLNPYASPAMGEVVSPHVDPMGTFVAAPESYVFPWVRILTPLGPYFNIDLLPLRTGPIHSLPPYGTPYQMSPGYPPVSLFPELGGPPGALCAVRHRPEFACGECGCYCHADPECDWVIVDIGDIVAAVDVIFRGGAEHPDPNAACPYSRADVNCDGFMDIVDIPLLVDVALRGFTAESKFCNPCAPAR